MNAYQQSYVIHQGWGRLGGGTCPPRTRQDASLMYCAETSQRYPGQQPESYQGSLVLNTLRPMPMCWGFNGIVDLFTSIQNVGGLDRHWGVLNVSRRGVNHKPWLRCWGKFPMFYQGC